MKTRLLILLTALLISGLVSAEPADTKGERKKVAVVLSGGGAKGMAHIGVLKVLEKAGIPIDIITGTSMGSIVGGLYAIGYNAHSLDSVARAQDWSYVISDRDNLRNQSLSDLKKQYTYAISTNIFGGKRNVQAGGLIKGKNLVQLFEKLCVGYTDSLDFSRDLPIPFACVATDIVSYTEYDFHSGRLPQAMRASMAIPAVFSPVRIDSLVLVDGGMRNNFPVDIAKQMGADIVIGVSVHDHPMTADDNWDTKGVLAQILDVNTKNKFEENKALTDVFMYVDPKGYGAASFSAAAIDTLIRRGEEEAMRHWDELIALKQRIGIDESFRPRILHPQNPAIMTAKQRVVGFEFVNMTPKDESFLRQKFHLAKLDSIDAAKEQEITTSMRIDLFYQTAESRLVPKDSGYVVQLTAGKEKTSRLYVGFRFDTEEYAALQAGLSIPLKTTTPINTEITARLGKRLMVGADLTIHPRSFTRPTFSASFRRNDLDVYVNGDRAYNVVYNQTQAELTPINFNWRSFNLQLGIRWDYMHYSSNLNSDSTGISPLKNEHFFSYRARITYNNEDNWIFPTRGARFNAGYVYLTTDFARLEEYSAIGTYLGKSTGLSIVNADWRMSFPFGGGLTIQPMLYGRLLFGSVVPHIFSNTIGGDWFGHYMEQQMPFAGVGCMEYVDNQFVAAQLQGQQRLGKNHYILLRVACAQQSDKVKDLLDSRTIIGVQGAYFYNTMFGPLGATLGYSNRTKEVYLYLNLGYEF
jgi:NTE family protein